MIEIDEKNVIITGERRWRASKMAGLKQIPCKIIEGLSAGDRLMRQGRENLQHEKLLPMEEAELFDKLLNIEYPRPSKEEKRRSVPKTDKGYSWLAGKLGISDRHISNRLKLLDKPDYVKKDVDRKKKKLGCLRNCST